MIFALYTAGILTFLGLVLLVRAALVAPHGVEDEKGFHTTEPSKTSAEADDMLPSLSDLSFFA